VALGILPLPHVEESLAELGRLAAQPAFRGVLVGVDSVGHAPDKLPLEPVLERVAASSYLFVVHLAGHEQQLDEPEGKVLIRQGRKGFAELVKTSPSIQLKIQRALADRAAATAL
jgi:hypothetical protein